MPEYRIEWAIDAEGETPRKAIEATLLTYFQGEWPHGVDHFVAIERDGTQHAIQYHAEYECDCCGDFHHIDDLAAIRDIFQRVAPGEPMPAGECPTCGGLCHARKAVRV
jgi:hypothetical protein